MIWRMLTQQAGTLAAPGGHVEHGETPAFTAEREVLEETGLRVSAAPVPVAVTNDIFDEVGKHYVTLYIQCTLVDPAAQPEVRK